MSSPSMVDFIESLSYNLNLRDDIAFNSFWKELDDDDEPPRFIGRGAFMLWHYHRQSLARRKMDKLLEEKREHLLSSRLDYIETIQPIIQEFCNEYHIIYIACEKFHFWIDYILQELHLTKSNLLDSKEFIKSITQMVHYIYCTRNNNNSDNNNNNNNIEVYIPPLSYATDRLKNDDRDFLIEIFAYSCEGDSCLPDFLSFDQHPGRKHLECFPNHLYDDREFMKRIIAAKHPIYFERDEYCGFDFVSPNLWRNDRTFIMWLLEYENDDDGVSLADYVFEYIIENFGPTAWMLDDSEIMLHAYKWLHYGFYHTFSFATPRLKGSKIFMMEAIEIYSSSYHMQNAKYDEVHPLAYAPLNLCDDLDLISFAVKKGKGGTGEGPLRYATPRIQGIKNLVLDAIRVDGSSIEFATPDLRNDKEVALVAVTNNKFAIQFVSPDLRNNDFDVAMTAVRHHGLQYVPTHYQRDRSIVLEAVRGHGDAIEFAHPDLLRQIDDKYAQEIAMYAVQKCKNIMALQYLNSDLRNNKKVVMASVWKKPRSIQYASSTLQKDPDVVAEAYLSELGRVSTDVILKPRETPASFFAKYFERWGKNDDPERQSSLIYYCLLNRCDDIIIPNEDGGKLTN